MVDGAAALFVLPHAMIAEGGALLGRKSCEDSWVACCTSGSVLWEWSFASSGRVASIADRLVSSAPGREL